MSEHTFFIEHWEAILTIGGGGLSAVAFLWYILKRTMPDLVNHIKEIEKTNKEVVTDLRNRIQEVKSEQLYLDKRTSDLGYLKRKEISDMNGIPIFQLANGCIRMRDSCTVERTELKQSICRKIEELKIHMNGQVKDISDSMRTRESEAKEFRDQMNRILGRVENLIEKNSQAQRKDEMFDLIDALSEKLAEKLAKPK
jgi:hypothetical protein